MQYTRAGNRTHPLPRLPGQRSSLGGAEKRDADPSGGGLQAFGGNGDSPAAGGALRSAATVHQTVPAIVQSKEQRAGGRTDQAQPAANTAVAAPAHLTAQRSVGQGSQGTKKEVCPRGVAGHDAQLPEPAGSVDMRATCLSHVRGSNQLANPEELKGELEKFLQGLQTLCRQQTTTEKAQVAEGSPQPRGSI